MENPKFKVNCPMCGSVLIVERGKYRCLNPHCEAYALQHGAYGRQVA
jgi:ribosomal protein S27E